MALSSYELSHWWTVVQQTKLPWSIACLAIPRLPTSTEIITSPLWLIVCTETADFAYMNTAVYELSAANPDLIAAFLEAD